MEELINVRVVSSKDLLEYDRRRRDQNAEWDNVNWEENELESGPGTDECETHLKIKNSYPTWKELFDIQRRTTMSLTCDVHLCAEDGYVPCHRMFLQEKSSFLDKLIKENLQINVPQPHEKNVITITLMGVQVGHLKAMMTLLYTGSCLVLNDKEEDGVKALLRLLQLEKVQCNREIIDANTIKAKKKKFRTVKSLRYGDPIESPAAENPQVNFQDPPATSNGAGPSGAPRPVPFPAGSTTSTTMSSAPPSVFQGEVLELRKMPPGSMFNKKQPERIQRVVIGPQAAGPSDSAPEPSGSAPGPSGSGPGPSGSGSSRPGPSCSKRLNLLEDSSDTDGPAPEPATIIQKTAPGAALKLHQQARIVRNCPEPTGSTAGGKRKGGKGKATSATATAAQDPENIDDDDEDADLNAPVRLGRYEQDDDFVPPDGADALEDADDEVEPIDDNDEEEIGSENEGRRPRTRNSAPLSDDKTRYPRRARRKAAAKADNKKKAPENKKDGEAAKAPNNNLGPPKSPRALRSKRAGSAAAKGSSRSSSLNTEEGGHRCYSCNHAYDDILELKNHLETSCARHLTTQYNIETRYCYTCQTFFKSYSAYEFMDHVKVCVCQSKPKRRSKGSAAGSTPLTSPVEPNVPNKSPPEPEKQFKREVGQRQTVSLDVMNMKKTSVAMDKLSAADVRIIQNRIRRKQPVCATRPNPLPRGFRYAFKIPDLDRKTKAPSTAPPQAPNPVPSPPHIIPPGSVRPSETSSVNETFPTASSSTFNPTYVSTPLCTDFRSKRSRPAPLSVKRKAMADATEREKARAKAREEPSKKPRQHADGQKENDEPVSREVAAPAAVSDTGSGTERNDPKAAAVVTTARKLKENLKKRLHPESVTTKTSSSSVQESSATSSNDATITNAVSAPEVQPPSTSDSITIVLPPTSAQKVVNGAEKPPSNLKSGSATSQESHAQRQLPKPGTTTVQQMIEKTIQESLNTKEKEKPATRAGRVPSNEQRAAQNSENQAQQRQSPVPTSTSKPTSTDSTQSEAAKSGPGPFRVSLNPQHIANAKPSYSAVIGARVSPKPSPPPASQQLPAVPIQQSNAKSASRPNVPQPIKAVVPTNTNNQIMQQPNHNQTIAQSNQNPQRTAVQPQAQQILQNLPASAHQAQLGTIQLTSQCTIQAVMTSPAQILPFPQAALPTPTAAVPLATFNTQGAQAVPLATFNTQGAQNMPDHASVLEVRRTPVQQNNVSPMANPGIQSGNNHAQQQQHHQLPGNQGAVQQPNQQLANAGLYTHISHSNVIPTIQTPPAGFLAAQHQGHRATNMPSQPISQQQSIERSHSTYPVSQGQSQIPPTSNAARGDIHMVQQQRQQVQLQQQLQQQTQQRQQQQYQATSSVSQAHTQMMQFSQQITSLQQTFHQQSQASLIGNPSYPFIASSNVYTSQPPCTPVPTMNIPRIQTIVPPPPSPAVVNFPVTAMMNPLSNNKSVSVMSQQPQSANQACSVTNSVISGIPSLGQVPDSNPKSFAEKNVAGGPSVESIDIKPIPNIVFVGPQGKVYHEESATCPDCGISFQSQETLLEHQNNGMCG